MAGGPLAAPLLAGGPGGAPHASGPPRSPAAAPHGGGAPGWPGGGPPGLAATDDVMAAVESELEAWFPAVGAAPVPPPPPLPPPAPQQPHRAPPQQQQLTVRAGPLAFDGGHLPAGTLGASAAAAPWLRQQHQQHAAAAWVPTAAAAPAAPAAGWQQPHATTPHHQQPAPAPKSGDAMAAMLRSCHALLPTLRRAAAAQRAAGAHRAPGGAPTPLAPQPLPAAGLDPAEPAVASAAGGAARAPSPVPAPPSWQAVPLPVAILGVPSQHGTPPPPQPRLPTAPEASRQLQPAPPPQAPESPLLITTAASGASALTPVPLFDALPPAPLREAGGPSPGNSQLSSSCGLAGDNGGAPTPAGGAAAACAPASASAVPQLGQEGTVVLAGTLVAPVALAGACGSQQQLLARSGSWEAASSAYESVLVPSRVASAPPHWQALQPAGSGGLEQACAQLRGPPHGAPEEGVYHRQQSLLLAEQRRQMAALLERQQQEQQLLAARHGSGSVPQVQQPCWAPAAPQDFAGWHPGH
jgi:hypothetical protein